MHPLRAILLCLGSGGLWNMNILYNWEQTKRSNKYLIYNYNLIVQAQQIWLTLLTHSIFIVCPLREKCIQIK